MNLAETHDLLTFIAAYDNRRFDDATVLAWQPIFAELEFGDCRTAVTQHFATSDAYLMPVHIRRLIAELETQRRLERARQAREAREAEIAAIEAADPTRRDRSEAIEALIDELRAKLPPGNPDSLRYASGYWREQREAREREKRAVPNPHYDPGALARLAEADPPAEPEGQ